MIAPLGQPSALPGEQVSLLGAGLTATTVTVLLSHPLLAAPISITPANATGSEVTFTVPAAAPAGFGTVSLSLSTPGTSDLLSNDVPFGVSPKITSPLPATVAASRKAAAFTVTCSPTVRAGQHAVLLIGGNPVTAPSITADTASLTFTVGPMPGPGIPATAADRRGRQQADRRPDRDSADLRRQAIGDGDLMTETETGPRSEWLTANGEFLAASLAWLRELLRQHAQARPQAAATGKQASAGAAEGRLGALAATAEDAAAGCVPPPALVALAQRTGLSRFEHDVLLLCAATELDPSIRGLCAAVHGNDAMAYPTFALALTVLPDPAWEALAPYGALREQRLIQVDRPRGESLISSPLRTDERIVNHLKGLDHIDARLHPLLPAAAARGRAPAAGVPPAGRGSDRRMPGRRAGGAARRSGPVQHHARRERGRGPRRAAALRDAGIGATAVARGDRRAGAAVAPGMGAVTGGAVRRRRRRPAATRTPPPRSSPG